MFGPSALNTDQVQEDRGGVGESSILRSYPSHMGQEGLQYEASLVSGSSGVLSNVPETRYFELSCQSIGRSIPNESFHTHKKALLLRKGSRLD